MSVAMAAYQMSFVEQPFYYFGVKLVKFAGKEEASFDTVPFQGTDNGIRAVSLVGCCEYEADLFLDGSVRTIPPLTYTFYLPMHLPVSCLLSAWQRDNR